MQNKFKPFKRELLNGYYVNISSLYSVKMLRAISCMTLYFISSY